MPFAELTLDTSRQRTFLVDVEGIEADAPAAAKARRDEAEAARRAMLRADLLAHLDLDEAGDAEARSAAWQKFTVRFADIGVAFPSSPWSRSHLQR